MPDAPGDEVEEQRALPAVARRQQDGDVADFLRDLVRRDGDRRVDAERDRGHHRGGDDRAVDEVVERVAEDDQRRRRRVHVAFVGVAVPQQHQFLEDEEDEDPGEERPEYARCCQRLERLGQQRQQRHAEQRADRVADEPRHQPLADVVVEEQQRRGDEQAA